MMLGALTGLPKAHSTLASRVCNRHHPGTKLIWSVSHAPTRFYSPIRSFSDVADRSVVGVCKELIKGQLSPTEVEVKGAFDDPNGSHIEIYCVAEAFEGKRPLARQQMVFKAIWDQMQGMNASHVLHHSTNIVCHA